MDQQAVDRALGLDGGLPHPLITGLTSFERDLVLEESLWFPDRPLPTGELADWAVALFDLGKDAALMASVSAIETTVEFTPVSNRDLPFVRNVLTELYVWINSTRQTDDLRRLGNLWWTLTRNPPQSADTPLGDAAVMAWLVAGYDPEGWGNPPEDSTKLLAWIDEAANNVNAVVDVFSCLQQSAALIMTLLS